MKNQIIYSVQNAKSTFFQRICSCLYFFKKSSVQHTSNNYQLGIDSPKGSYSGGRKILVLDLDETLVHSQFNAVEGFDFSIEIIVQGQLFKVFVTLRPGVEAFIEQVSEYYDVVMWTASLREYADPVMDFIDPQRRAIARLYRESCSPLKGGLAKNLAKLGRDLKDVVIIDNSAMSFCLQPENGFQIKDFYNDKKDRELENLVPFFAWLSQQMDVRPVSQHFTSYCSFPESLLNSKRPSFVGSRELMEGQYKHYEQELIQSQNARMSKSDQGSQSMVVRKDQAPGSRTMTLTNNLPDYDEEIELRDRAGLNSPHGELNKDLSAQDQTDDEEKETFEIAQ